jgi:hypothetical protein
MTERTTSIEVTPRATPRIDKIVIKLKKREFFFDLRYRSPTQKVHGLLHKSLRKARRLATSR